MSGIVSPGQSADQQAGAATATEASAARRPGRGRWAAASVVGVVVAAAVVLAITDPFRAPAPASARAGGTGYHTSTAMVARRPLTSQTQVDATLGDAGSYSVVNQAQGTITALTAAGQVVREGQVLYAVSGAPVVLLYGHVPAWRSLTEGMSGQDVAELNADLVKLGYATWAELGTRSDYFSAATVSALESLQAKLGVAETGSLALGQAAFLPTAALVTGPGTGVVPGGQAMPGSVLLTATSTTPVVTIALDAAQQTEVKDGDQVVITLPDGNTTPGVVSQVSTVATSSGSSADSAGSGGSGSSDSSGSSGSSGSSATITVLVALSDPKAAGSLNQAPVEVTITTGSVPDTLVVPVDALLAQASSGYAVEVIGADGTHHLVAVTPGVFDDAAGLVQVTGRGLTAGQRVVVPAI